MKHDRRRSPSRRSLFRAGRNPARRGSKGQRPRIGLCPHASRLLLAGYIVMVISLSDFAARLYAGESPAALMYIDAYMSSVASATLLLWAAALGLDYLERTER